MSLVDKILCPPDLYERWRPQLDRISSKEFRGGLNIKKLRGHNIFRLKRNYADRLTFAIIKKDGINLMVPIEEILNHAYPKKLKDIQSINIEEIETLIEESKLNIDKLPDLTNDTDFQSVVYENEKFIVLNDEQNKALETSMPMLVNGPAGSGKTTVALATLAKCAQLYANSPLPILYVTESHSLRNNVKEIWEASPDKSDKVEFRTYEELFGGVKIADKKHFLEWMSPDKKVKKTDTDEIIYEEFRLLSDCEKLEDYLSLGRKHSQIEDEEARKRIWTFYVGYKKFLKTNNSIDPSFEKLPMRDSYAAIVVDEAQDLSMGQLKELSLAAEKRRICYCMDNHQSLNDRRSKSLYISQLLYEYTKQEPNIINLPYSFRCPQRVSEATTALVELKKRIARRADRYEVTEILSAPGAAPGNVHWVEPSKLSDEQTSWFNEVRKSKDFAVITLAKHVSRAIDLFGTKLVFTPKQAKGLEFNYVVAFELFDEPIYSELNLAIEKKIVDEKFRKPINHVITAFTRAQKTLIIYQKKEERHGNIIRLIPHSAWVTAEAVIPSSLQEWKQTGARLNQGKNTKQQAALIAQDTSFSLDKVLALHQKQFPKAMDELLKNPNFLEILGDERTAHQKTIFEAIDNKKWHIFMEKITAFIKEHSITKLINLPLTEAERIFKTFGKSDKAIELIMLLRKEVFYEAMEIADYVVVKNCLIAGIDPNIPNCDGRLPLIYAADNDDLELLELLLEYGADIDLPENDGHNALTLSAINGAPGVGEVLLDFGANPNFKSSRLRKPALIIATEERNKAFVKMLLSRDNTDVNITADGVTALHVAASMNNVEILQMLAQHKGCDLNRLCRSKNNIGTTALHEAIDRKDLVAAIILVEAGCDKYAPDSFGSLPFSGAIMNGVVPLVEYFIKQHIDVNYKDKFGATPLSLSASIRNLEIATMLLNKGARIIQDDKDNYLTTAVLDNDMKFTELYMSFGANPNFKTKKSVKDLQAIGKKHNVTRMMDAFIKSREVSEGFIAVSAMDIAVILGNKDMLALLRQVTPDTYLDKLLNSDGAAFEENILNLLKQNNVMRLLTTQKTKQGKSLFEAIDDAKFSVFLKVLDKYLVDEHATGKKDLIIEGFIDLPDPNSNLGNSENAKKFVEALVERAFTPALKDCNVARVKNCLRKSSDPLVYSANGANALNIATEKRSLEIMEILLNADYTAVDSDDSGVNPLHICGMSGFREGAALLLERGAVIDAYTTDTPSGNALQFAIQEKQILMVMLLLQHGADVNSTNNQGTTALLHAASINNTQIVQMLLDTKKCKLNVTDVQGYAAIHYAVKNGNLEMIQALLQAGADPQLAMPTNGSTPLMFAVFSRNAQLLSLFLELSLMPTINQADKNGYTALLLAVDTQNELAVKLLLEKKASTLPATIYGETALAIAIARGNINIAELLLKNGCDYHSPLTLNLQNLKRLLKLRGRLLELAPFMIRKNLPANCETIAVTPAELTQLCDRIDIFRMIKTKEKRVLPTVISQNTPSKESHEATPNKPGL